MSKNKPRPSLQWFAEQMEAKLKENEHKGDWDEMLPSRLLDFLQEEVIELKNEIHTPLEVKRDRIIKKCADVANFAMMIADNVKIKKP